MKFALITEGVSEYRIVKHIISRYFKDHEPDINQIQPRILNEKQENPGGWNEVLKYCERKDLKNILIENDYLVIQIDSDQSEIMPFNVAHTKRGGESKTTEELYEEILLRLNGLIQDEIRELHEKKIFFAICIHTIECWLLPLYCDNNHKSDTLNCLGTLNNALYRNNVHKITGSNKNDAHGKKAYAEILSKMKKKIEITNAAQHNIGFNKFIESLKSNVVESAKE